MERVMALKVAVLGATGMVGREVLGILAERGFPADEVIALPVTNTSVEQLSKLLAETFYRAFQSRNVARVSVFVEETPGQGAETHAP